MLYGRQPRLPMDVSLLPPSKLSVDQSQYRSTIVKNLAIAQKLASERNEIQQKYMKAQYDKKAAPPKFTLGQKVMVHDPTKKAGLTKKLSSHYLGPYNIIEQPSPVLVRLEGMGPQKSSIVHVNRLKLCPDPSKHSLRLPEVPETLPKPLPGQILEPPPPNSPTSSSQPTEDRETNTCATRTCPNTPSLTEVPPSSHPDTNSGQPGTSKEETTKINPFLNPIPNQTIINHRRRNKTLEYLIQNENETPATAVWERSTDIENTDLISKYLKTQEHYPTTRSKTRLIASVNVLGTVSHRMPSWYQVLLLIFLIYLALPLTQSQTPNLGPLYNCDITQYMGVYTIPNPLSCLDNPSGHEIHSFEAQVNQYQPPTTQIPIYLCTLTKVTLTCSETFFASKEKQIATAAAPFPIASCRRASYLKTSQYGKLIPSGFNVWKTPSKKHYKCEWLKTKISIYYSLIVTAYTATLEGDDKQLHQTLTSSKCNYHSHSCAPIEQPYSTIVWRNFNHKFTIYKNRGVFPVKQINNFFLVPSLGIGGTIVSETASASAYLLDTGFQIIRKNKGTSHIPQSFYNYSRQYVTHTKSNTQRDLGRGRIAQQFIHEHEIVTQLAHSLCLANKELRQFQRWILNSFADTASEYLFPEPGKLVEPLGEGLLLHSCQTIHKYNIFWNQTYNDTCYTTFPVISPSLTKLYFLELNKRRLVSQGHKIPCSKNKKHWYVTDKDGTLWQLEKNKFHRIHKFAWAILKNKIELTKIGHFNLQLLHYDEKIPSRISLLTLLSRNKDNLEDLGQFRSEGEGDIISGIGKILGTTISSLSKGGSQIIRSIGIGIRDTLSGIGNLDESVVGSIGNATSNIIKTSSTAIA